MTITEAIFKVGDGVAFRRMCQPGYPPLIIDEVDANMFDVRYRIGQKWWMESNLMPFEEWNTLKKESLLVW